MTPAADTPSPSDPRALNEAGIALARQDRFSDAEAQFREAIRLQPSYPEALNNLGNALASQEKWDEAIGCYRHALALRPDYARAYINRAAPGSAPANPLKQRTATGPPSALPRTPPKLTPS